MKTILKLAIAIVLWSGIPSCCDVPSTWIMKGFNVKFQDDIHGTFDLGVTNADSIILIVTPEVETFASVKNWLGNEALAFTCPEPLLQHATVDFTITSNNDFNEIKAGEPLNSKLFYWQLSSSVADRPPFVHHSGTELSFAHHREYFVFREKPAITKHIFTVTVTDELGNKIVGSSKEITWY
ncbi:MAG: hypothetical protein CMN32_12050 [Saprospirales bacterium]|nr:hypothetical protein [Saprospirales bacterium]